MINDSPTRQDLAATTGRRIDIQDPVTFFGPVEFTELRETPIQRVPLSNATPSVLNLERLVFENTSPVLVTNFIDGQEGQYFIALGDGNTVVVNNANIVTSSGSNTTLANGNVYAFVLVNGQWREQGGAPVPNLGPLNTVLSSAVTLTTSGTWTTILSLTLTPGSWLVHSISCFTDSHSGEVLYGVRIHDTTNNTTLLSGQMFAHNKVPNTDTVSIGGIVSIAGTATVALQAITDTGGSVVQVQAQTPNFASGNTATILSAIRVA